MRKITLRDIPQKGRGVVASSDIAAGEEVERSPVLPLALADSECDGLRDYALAWGEDMPGFEAGKECAVGLGYLSLYNHATDSNVTLERHYAQNEISVRAKRAIAAGDELTIDYGIALWFEPH